MSENYRTRSKTKDSRQKGNDAKKSGLYAKIKILKDGIRLTSSTIDVKGEEETINEERRK